MDWLDWDISTCSFFSGIRYFVTLGKPSAGVSPAGFECVHVQLAQSRYRQFISMKYMTMAYVAVYLLDSVVDVTVTDPSVV